MRRKTRLSEFVRTFATMIQDAHNIHREILAAQRIVITAHRSPDGDSIGSSLAVYHLLKKWGKDVTVVHPDPAPEYLQWVPGQPEIVAFESDPAKGTALLNAAGLIVCLDYNEPSRVGKDMQPALENAPGTKVMIDHHLHPSDFCQYRISEPEACSTAQLVYEWMEAVGCLSDLDATIGTCMYLGILTDTGSFRFPSVTSKTHQVVGHLISVGVKHHEIHENVYDDNTIERIRLKGYALSEKLVQLDGIPVAYITLTKEELERFGYKKGDTEGLVNQVLGIRGIKMAALFTQKDDIIRISFRSKGAYTVNEMAAKYFNGGGHIYASGGSSEKPMDETTREFVTKVREFIPVA